MSRTAAGSSGVDGDEAPEVQGLGEDYHGVRPGEAKTIMATSSWIASCNGDAEWMELVESAARSSRARSR